VASSPTHENSPELGHTTLGGSHSGAMVPSGRKKRKLDELDGVMSGRKRQETCVSGTRPSASSNALASSPQDDDMGSTSNASRYRQMSQFPVGDLTQPEGG